MRFVKKFFFLLCMWLFTMVICLQDLKITKVGEWGSGNRKLSFDIRFNIGLSTLANMFSSFPTRNELGVYALSDDYSQRNHSLNF